jgi:Peptidase family M28
MKLRIPTLAALLMVLCFSPAAGGPQQKRAAFDGQAAYDYDKALASDAMQGRESGEPGERMAADYIVSKFKEWGLEPAGANGGYFQDFTFEYNSVARDAALEVFAGEKKRDFIFGEDWRQQRYSGSASVIAEIVFVGYGISAPGKQYDDYAGVDVKGKLVLLSTDSPRRFGDKLSDEAEFQARVRAAQDHGACGVLTFRSETQATGFGGFRGNLKKDVYKPAFAIVTLEGKVVDFIFKHLLTDPRSAFQQVEMTGKPQSLQTGVRCALNLNVTLDEKRPARNVLAKITGADKNLKSEYVIIGGHYDHLGIDPTGDVFNGADDNASGTAVVMEVARTMKSNRAKPKRTVIFALWGAEEEGLLGSKYYTENPLYPLDKTVTYINLDMEGEGNGRVSFSGVYYAPYIWDIVKPALPKDILANVDTGRGGPGGSDHTYFLSQGVAAYSVFTQGPHFRTNRVGDVIDMIKPEVLKKSGDFVEAAVGILADAPKFPVLPHRRESYFWKNLTVANFETPPLEQAIAGHKDAVDPDVDFQLAVVGEKAGVTGDALKVSAMNGLLDGLDAIRASKGLTAYSAGGAGMMGRRMFGRGGPAKTTVLAGLKGTAAFGDDPRWADVFSKAGIAFVAIDGPGALFREKALSDDGRRMVEALGKANLLLVVKGLDSAQSRSLLENAKKPVFLETAGVPEKDVIDLVKKTGSAIGLVMGKDEDAASYFSKLDAAKKAAGAEYVAIVTENGLWGDAGQAQMIGLIGEMLKAKYENDDLSNLASGAFLRALGAARATETAGAPAFMMF